MKTQILVLSVAVTAQLLAATRAESMPIHDPSAALRLQVSAHTCFSCWGNQALPYVTIDALFTVVPETGRYYDPLSQDYLHGPFLKVVAIEGTFNGIHRMSMAFPPNGAKPWFYPHFSPGYVYFSAGGITSRLIDDGGLVLVQTPTGGGYGTQAPLIWNVVQVPDQSSSVMLAMLGLISLMLLKRRSHAFRPRQPVVSGPRNE